MRRADRKLRDRGHGQAGSRRRRPAKGQPQPDLRLGIRPRPDRAGPEAHAVAYGTLLQCYAGFAGLNRHPNIAPRVGFAWLDPMCGLMLAFLVAAALWHRRKTGNVARIDFSMIEAMLWTMAQPLLQTQLGTPPQPPGNESENHF